MRTGNRWFYSLLSTVLLALSALSFATAYAEDGDDDEDSPPATVSKKADSEKPAQIAWLKTVEEGQRHALREGMPVLIWVGAAWCPVCKKLAEEFESPAIHAELARWTLVYIDVDQSEAEAEKLNVVKLPLLRIIKADGHRVASREGTETLEDPAGWLQSNYEEAVKLPDEILAAAGPPEADDVMKLVRQFNDRSPTIREAAIRRLMRHPQAASEVVVDSFVEGSLSTRLAALELLQEWKAPIADLDPWRPETFTAERLAKLETWRKESATVAVEAPEELTESQRNEVGTEIARMLKTSDAEAGAIRERLARLGPAMLPLVYERLKEAAADRDRERLLALRYRLVASDVLALQWPGGLLRLAATETAKRQKAAEELAARATAADQALLRELFSDPDPLVREICLRGLQNIGDEAQAALVDLLADPEPNVRAAVLKQLEENPIKGMIGKIAEYVKTEKDSDLVVHAVRFLHASKDKKAKRSLIELLKHESWQVRAEAAGALGGREYDYVSYSSSNSGEPSEAEQLKADAYAALIELLEDQDSFVVSKAVEGLAGADMVVAVEPLVKAAESHPDLAVSIIQNLASGQTMRQHALPHLHKFYKHDNPAIRAAALSGMVSAADNDMQEEITAGMSDADSRVRIAAANALFKVFENLRQGAHPTARPNYRAIPSYASPMITKSTTSSVFGEVAKLLGGFAKKVASPPVPTPVEEEFRPTAPAPPGDEAEKPAVESPEKNEAEAEPVEEKSMPESQPPAPDAVAPEESDSLEVKPATTAPPVIRPHMSIPHPSNAPAPVPLLIEALPPGGRYQVIDEVEPVPVPNSSSPFAPVTPPSVQIDPLDGDVSDVVPLSDSPLAPSELDAWLKKFYEGKPRPEWTTPLIESLEKMLSAESLDERVAAAQALAPLGKSELAVPVLMEAAKAKPEHFNSAGQIMPWLEREKRLAFFRDLRVVADGEGGLRMILEGMASARDSRDEDLFWEILGEEKTTINIADQVYTSLLPYYSISRGFNTSSGNTPVKKSNSKLAKKLLSRTTSGSEFQRLVALALLTGADPGEAAEESVRMAGDSTLSEELRRDAFHLSLLAQPDAKARVKMAVDALKQSDPARSKIALKYLVNGISNLHMLRDRIFLSISIYGDEYESVSTDQPIIPQPPKGLKLDDIRPLLKDSSPEIAAYAGYLAALFEDPDGMDLLLNYWREQGKQNSTISYLVYRAAAVLDDPKYVHELREIYGKMQEYEVSRFYWTIRIMSGPEILKFRKEIREKHGMSGLQ